MISSRISRFSSKILKPVHVHAHNIIGSEWWCTDNNGRGIICSAGNGSAPSPTNYLLMALGACSGSGIKFNLEKRGKEIRNLDIDITGDWVRDPSLRIGKIQLNVTVDADIDQQTFSKIVEDVKEKFCPVAGTLLRATNITSAAFVK